MGRSHVKGDIMRIAILALAAFAAGCASRAGAVAPISISASEYSGLSCEDTRAQLDGARAREVAFTRKQNTAATVDAVGVFLVLVPASSLLGGDVEGELAQAKGEVRALERAVVVNCAAPAGP